MKKPTRVDLTNQEALASKLSAIALQYYRDQFAQQLTDLRSKGSPVMNRGYWARTMVFKTALYDFMGSKPGHKQVINVGSGLDTLFYCQSDHFKHQSWKYVEVDLHCVTERKTQRILSGSLIKNKLGEAEYSQFGIEHKVYSLRAADITNPADLERALQGLDLEIPTLVLIECVLTYLPDKGFQSLMGVLTRFKDLRLVCYEFMNGEDEFGQSMAESFEARGIPLLGLSRHRNLLAVKSLFYQQYSLAGPVQSMLHYYNTHGLFDKSRVQAIEQLNDPSLWNAIMGHYFVADLFHSSRQ